jgi:elongation factor P
MLAYNELKVGTLFIKDGEPYEVLEYAFIRMQQRKPVAQLKIRNMISGKVQNYTAHQNEAFEEAEIEKMPVKYLYNHRDKYYFSDINNPKNRFCLDSELLSNDRQYLKPNTEVEAVKFGEKILKIELPIKVDLKVVETPPAVKGATAAGGTKIATLEGGAKVSVPFFINEGDIIRVNTKTGEYCERVEKS